MFFFKISLQKVCLIILQALFCAVSILGQEADESADASVVPHVIAVQTTTRGKVVLLDDSRAGRAGLDNLSIQLWTYDDNQLIYETRTDADGFFDLPRSELGLYIIAVGRMRLVMKVIAPPALPAGVVEGPKVLFIMVSSEALCWV